MIGPPVVVAWSGGKDSAMTLHALRQSGASVAGLLTTVNVDYDRVSIHGFRREILHAQARAAGLPLYEAALPAVATNDIYEESFAAALRRIESDLGVRPVIAFGDLFLEDVREYRLRLLDRLGFEPLFPLWGRNTGELAQQFLADGFSAVICCVDTTQLAASFAGSQFDAAFLAALPDAVDPCGENGEFHSCLTAGPVMRGSLQLEPGERVLREARFEYIDLMLVDGN